MATRSLSDAISALLPTNKKTLNADVVLSRRKAPARKLEEARIEASARKALKREHRSTQKSIHDDLRAKRDDDEAFLNRERMMRKRATRGVVAIFNAVREKQEAKEAAARAERERKRARLAAAAAQASSFTAGKQEGEEETSSIIKNSFLELLKTSMAVSVHQKRNTQ